MTATRGVQIACDGCGTLAPFLAGGVDEARASAASEGWSVPDNSDASLDLCESCRVPAVMRRGDDVIVSCGHKIVGRYPFPLSLPSTEWRDHIERLMPREGQGAPVSDLGAAIATALAEFVRVEQLVTSAEV